MVLKYSAAIDLRNDNLIPIEELKLESAELQ